MIAGLDSSFDAPTLAQAREAYASGVRVWGGYIGTRDGLGLAVRWNEMSFWNVRQAGLTPIGFCSGHDDPAAIRDLAAAWGVLPCVDVETGIRDDGDWVQGWLDASGAGLYGNSSVHYNTGGRRAAFHVVAWYFLRPPACYDPGMAWPWWLPALPAPAAWQFCGTHDEFGLSVDRGWYDDWFAGALTGGTVLGGIPFRGGGMGPIVHPTIPNRRDYIYVSPGGGVTHAWWDGANAYTEDIGGQAAPGMVGGAWIDAGTLVLTHVGAADGQLYEQAISIDGLNRTGWYPIYGRAALPAPGPQGPQGPAGPQGLPGVVGSHTHQLTAAATWTTSPPDVAG